MKDFNNITEQIKDADSEISHVFKKRLGLIKQASEEFRRQGLPDKALDLYCKSDISLDDEYQPYYIMLKNQIDSISKAYSQKILCGMNIAYSGIKGAFGNIVARKIFPGGNYIGFPDFKKAYDSVVSGECDCAVLPLENSYAGVVGQVLDLVFEGPLYINGEYTLKVTHYLVGTQNAQIGDIKTVISHSQALGQCEKYIAMHNWNTEEYPNTAIAAKQVAALNDRSVAAIASRETAYLYDLKLLDHDINESAVNTTKFAVLSRSNITSDKNQRFILFFTVEDVSGALAKAINIISEYGFNMKVLRSRPVKDKAWQYYFYVEIEGNENAVNSRSMLDNLKAHCNTLKIAGSYTGETEL